MHFGSTKTMKFKNISISRHIEVVDLMAVACHEPVPQIEHEEVGVSRRDPTGPEGEQAVDVAVGGEVGHLAPALEQVGVRVWKDDQVYSKV